MICEVRPGGHYGYNGPRDKRPPDLPLVYLPPHGLDNSSGGQIFAESDRFGPLGRPVDPFLVRARGRTFWCSASGLTVSRKGRSCNCRASSVRGPTGGGSTRRTVSFTSPGWPAGGRTPSVDDGCFRESASDTRAGPCSCRPPSTPTRTGCWSPSPARSTARRPRTRGARSSVQAWNYHYPSAVRLASSCLRATPGQPGHDPLPVRSGARPGRRPDALSLEIPDLQPVNQLHLHLRPGFRAAGRPFCDGSQAGGARSPASPATSPPRKRSRPTRCSPTCCGSGEPPPAPNPWRTKLPGVAVGPASRRGRT